MGILRYYLVVLLACSFALPALASVINFQSTHLGGTTWRYDYTVDNAGAGVPIEEWTIYFDRDRYSNLKNIADVPQWDVLALQPDLALSADGVIDGLAKAAGIAPGASQSGFAVTFDYAGNGSPGSQPFEIWDPVSYVLLYAGNTEPLVHAVPLPSTIALLLAAGLAWLISAARLRHTTILRVLGVALSVLVTTSLAQASPQLTISSLQKTGEKRINRTVFEYTFKTSVTNAGQAPEKNVTAELIKAGDGTDIISGVIAAGDIAAGATVHPAGTLVVRHDRTFPFSLASLSWAVEAEPSAMLDDLDHAEVYVIPLAELGISLPAISVSATGAVREARIVDGSLRFWTPGDPGRDEYGNFLVHTGLGITSLTALIRSQRPTRAATVIEAMENGELPAPRPRLNVEGLGANNSLTGGPLTFRLASNPGGDFKDDSRAELVAAGNSVIALQDYWTYNPADASFTIDTPAMAEILTRLAPGTSSMSVNFVSKDGEFAAVYELLVLRPSASLNGRFISQDGGPVATLSGMHVLLKGYAGSLRKAAVIGSDGRFTFEGLVPDTYQLTLSDLANPNVTTASTAVFLDSTNVDVSIVYAKPSAGKAGSQKLAPGRSHGSKSSQDGTPPSRSGADRVIARERLPSAGQPGEKSLAPPVAVFSAVSDGQSATVSIPVEFAVPVGSTSVGVKVTVSTAEYPYWTTQQSEYNDTWSYAVNGLPGTTLAGAGSVNQSHYTQGSVARSACVSVKEQTGNAALQLTGSVAATNIGDGQFATESRVEFFIPCSDLLVTSAMLSSPNSAGRPVLQPLNVPGNLPGPYLSIPRQGPISTHTLPLDIVFAPVEAEITEIYLGTVINGGEPVFSGANLISQATLAGAGKLRLASLVLSDFPEANTHGKIGLMVRLHGKVDNTAAQSDPENGGQVSFKSVTAFTPLYLAGEDSELAQRRYPARDPGGDSWATAQVVDWLGTNAFRFNDISGQHVTQTPGGRSILNHSGHSDGQQLDLRYADGQGGYSDALGGVGDGMHIKQLIDDAAKEVATNAVNKPRLAALVAWIEANRSMIETNAINSVTRRIYIGPSFIKTALVDGKFSAAAKAPAIPGVNAWKLPAKVMLDPTHMNHWHISLDAHP